MQPDLLERLRAQLRRDPSDGEIAFLLSLIVRDPFITYSTERVRLRRFLSMQGRSARELLIAEAAEQLLARSVTPSRGLRRPESGSTEIVKLRPDPLRPAVGDEAELPAPKGSRERETDPAPPKKG
ncbi:MAG: hypothetical protein M5U28_14115 [Sandaracinaceae bacterium]|nr:hypothetical protein [Sandaracinaceae bacterium]